eukprot:8229868-Karenia_brevis.AAC.1
MGEKHKVECLHKAVDQHRLENEECEKDGKEIEELYARSWTALVPAQGVLWCPKLVALVERQKVEDGCTSPRLPGEGWQSQTEEKQQSPLEECRWMKKAKEKAKEW